MQALDSGLFIFSELYMKSIIYQWQNILNKKVYIGQTGQILKERKSEHLTMLKGNYHCNLHLQNAFNKYGKDNFIIEPLLEIEGTQAEINDIETQMINAVPENMRYNIALIGGASFRGRTHSPESRTKMSKARKGKLVGNKNPFYGKTHSIEARERLSETGKNRITTLETRERMSKAFKGRKHSLEHRMNLSKAWRNREPMKDETRKKMSESRIGKPLKVEHCLSIAKATKGERNPNSTITEIQAREIKFKHLPENILTQKEIAKMYNVGRGSIQGIKSGKIWKHLIR